MVGIKTTGLREDSQLSERCDGHLIGIHIIEGAVIAIYQ